MKKFFKITKNDRILGIVLMILSVVTIVFGILLKLEILKLSSDTFIKTDTFTLILIIIGTISLIYSIFVTIVAFNIKDNI